MDFVQESVTVATNVILSLSALHTSIDLFKDHRAPSLGFFLIACSSALAVLPLSGSSLISMQKDLEWAGQTLGPSLAAFGFLWLSEDRSTARALLIGSALLLTFADWLSPDGLVIATRFVALSALSCSLTVCLFAGNMEGAVGSVGLCLPALAAPGRIRGGTLEALVYPDIERGLLGWTLKAFLAVGCWSTRRGLCKFLQDLEGWD